jgi:hypothetical protein
VETSWDSTKLAGTIFDRSNMSLLKNALVDDFPLIEAHLPKNKFGLFLMTSILNTLFSYFFLGYVCSFSLGVAFLVNVMSMTVDDSGYAIYTTMTINQAHLWRKICLSTILFVVAVIPWFFSLHWIIFAALFVVFLKLKENVSIFLLAVSLVIATLGFLTEDKVIATLFGVSAIKDEYLFSVLCCLRQCYDLYWNEKYMDEFMIKTPFPIKFGERCDTMHRIVRGWLKYREFSHLGFYIDLHERISRRVDMEE